jgi:hypothetical protein
MQIILNLFAYFVHFVFCFFIFMSVVISNNMNVLTFFLIIMILTRLCHWMYGGCILTTYEKNDYFATTAHLFSKTITNVKLQENDMELLVINLMILMILNKIFGLTVLSYYKIPSLQKYIHP